MSEPKMNPVLKDIKPKPEHDTVKYLADEIEKSDKKIAELRNFLEDAKSKLLVENSFNRYLREWFRVKVAAVTNVTLKK